MRFSAPVPAATEPPVDQSPLALAALPPIRGQVFTCVVAASGTLEESLPLPAGTRVRVTVVSP